MADDRQFQIREKAGLEESRLNQDFIDLLRKVSTPLLVVVALIVGSYALYTRYTKSQLDNLNLAFAELNAATATDNPNPTTLIDLATQHKGFPGVALKARLDAADAYLRAVRRHVALGAQVEADGTITNSDGVLTPQLREQYLAAAREQYELVLNSTKGDPAKAPFSISAAFGLAAVAESEANFSAAEARYDEAATLADSLGMTTQAAIARNRKASMDSIRANPQLISQSELPKPPAPPAPAAPAPEGPTPPPPTETPATPAPQPEQPAPDAPK
jgi:hypothetical protein